MPQPQIVLENVTRTYRMGDVDLHALDGVSLAIEEGDFVAVMGASGSGKSTLMNIIGCLDRPSSGRYLLDGRDVSRLRARGLAEIRNQTVGFVFQSFNLLARTSALENVELPLVYGGMRTRQRRQSAADALYRVGLGDRLDHHPSQLSGGQQQRVAIARALAGQPRIILADEPTGNLDSRTSVEIMELFGELSRSGITILLVTHAPEVSAYASRVVSIKDGKIEADSRQRANGTPAIVASDSSSARERKPTLWETQRVAIRALLRNKMRSFLTTLGIIIGVGAVIAMVAIGEGAKARVEEAFSTMGTSVLILSSGTTTAGGAHGGFGSMPTLTWEDLKAIQALPSVERAAPRLHVNAQVLSEDANWTTQVQGTTPEFFEIRKWSAEKGNLFTHSDVEVGSKVVLLGSTVAERLFGASTDPVGHWVRIRNVPFVIMGVMESKGQSQSGTDYDDTVFVPTSTYLSKVQGGLQKFVTGTIVVGAISDQATAKAEREITNLLRDRHHLAPGIEDDFSIRNLAETASAKEEGARTLTTLLASIAAVSLLVGGIGIMNIMLVSVTERTREIGVRMAVGAKPNHILAQFLVEALTLSVMGGLLGVALGLGAAERLATRFTWPLLIRIDIIAIAIAFSGLVGIAFGLYPARKASRLNPIDALRYE